MNGDDESICGSQAYCQRISALDYQPPPPPPARIAFHETCDMIYSLNRTEPTDTSLCPDTHYLCPESYCLPIFTRCNGVFDCPDHVDERNCDSYVCPGYYRCRDSKVCLHPSQVCDGMLHCPRSDDELLCDVVCPDQCTCHGLAFTCQRPFSVHDYPDLRYLNAKGGHMTLEMLKGNIMLVYLSLASCNLTKLGNFSLPNINTLDLSDNQLSTIEDRSVTDMTSLKVLFLSNNPISTFLSSSAVPRWTFTSVQTLEVSRVILSTVNERLVSLFPNIRVLNLSQCGTQRVVGRGLQAMAQLRILDMTGSPMSHVQKDTFQGLKHLQVVYADNYKLCCVLALLEGFNVNNCHAPVDEISSCNDLLRSAIYRGFLAMFTTLAIIGNLGSFAYRLASTKRSGSSGFSVFVLHPVSYTHLRAHETVGSRV